VAHRTPVFTSATLDRLTGATVRLKMESLQRSGSFKFRGAYSRISLLSPEELGRGVVAYSSGNHAQAVALAAGIVDTSAVIVMPADAPPEKLEATRGYGAEVVTYDRYTEDRAEIGQRIADDRGLTLVPPYDDLDVMAGQGTAALELVEEAGPLDVLVTPVSGGGLIAGCGTAARAAQGATRVVGVEPEQADDTRRSLEAGERVRLDEVPHTIADGLAVDSPGELTFPINRDQLERVVTVSEDDLVDAMAFLFDRLKAVVEPSGAAGVAALLTGRVPDLAGRRVGVIVSGGNVSADRFASFVAEHRGG
jgi:threonine dehydratase